MTPSRNSGSTSHLWKVGALAASLAFCLGMPACSDNPEGNPDRGSISAPRDKIEGGGDAKPAGEGKDAGKKGTSDAARKIDI